MRAMTLDQLESNSGDTHGEGPRLEEHHRPHDLGGEGRADRRGVRPEDRLLKALGLRRVDADAGQIPQPCGDAVDRRTGGDGLLDDASCGGHVLGKAGCKIHGLACGHGDY